MNVLELFAGSCSFGNVAKELGYNVFCTDIQGDGWINIDLRIDILDIEPKMIPFKPDIIWASPPCQTFSVASISTYWGGGVGAYIPKKAKSYVGLALVQKAKELIEHYNPKYWYIENPRGVLRKLDVVKDLPIRNTVTYCSYGGNNMKPTDIWTNDSNWKPRKMCKNGNRNCHHQPAPRGSKTGTQGLKGSYERSKVPPELCLEILKGINKK